MKNPSPRSGFSFCLSQHKPAVWLLGIIAMTPAYPWSQTNLKRRIPSGCAFSFRPSEHKPAACAVFIRDYWRDPSQY